MGKDGHDGAWLGGMRLRRAKRGGVEGQDLKRGRSHFAHRKDEISVSSSGASAVRVGEWGLRCRPGFCQPCKLGPYALFIPLFLYVFRNTESPTML